MTPVVESASVRTMRELLDLDGVLALLRWKCQEAGSQKAFADKHGLSKQYLSDVVRGDRPPGPAILRALGLDVVTRYRRTR